LRTSLASSWFAGTLIGLTAVGPSLAVPSPLDVRPRVGVVTLPPRGGEADPRVSDVLETRLIRWLEGHSSGAGILAERAPRGVFHATQVRALVDAGRLAALVESARAGKLEAGEWAQMRELALREPALAGSVVAAAMLVLADRSFRHADERQARGYLSRALALHPEGKPETAEGWPEDGSARDAGFLALVESQRSEIRWQCHWKIEGNSEVARVRVNGFAVVPRGEKLTLAVGLRHRLTLVRNDGGEDEHLLDCRQARSASVAVGARRGGASSEQRQGDPFGNGGYQALVLAEPEGDAFRLYLYLPHGFPTEIRVARPIRISQLATLPSGEGLPILSDAFQGLFSSSPDSSGLSGVPAGVMAVGGQSAAVAAGVPKRGIATGWWVAAGLVGSVALVLWLTREGRVETQPRLVIRLD